MIIDCNELDIVISRFLIKIGMPPHVKGYKLTREIIIEILKNDRNFCFNLTKLYNKLAIKFDTKSSTIEKNIRYAIKLSFNRCKSDLLESYFGEYIKYHSTNYEFISAVCEYLRIHNKSLFKKNYPL